MTACGQDTTGSGLGPRGPGTGIRYSTGFLSQLALPTHNPRMRVAQIDFKREGRWLLPVALLVPAIGMLLAIVLPALFSRS